MKISRKRLCELKGVYSVSVTTIAGQTQILAASELRGGDCMTIDPRTGETGTVWQGPGGTMSIVPLEGRHLFAVQKFYAGFDAAASIIVEAQANGTPGAWEVRERAKLPYLHRLTKVGNAAQPTLLACTLCGGKDHVDDWVRPGAVYRISLDGKESPAWEIVPVIQGIRRNHGLSLTRLAGEPVALVSGMEGVFSIALPGGRPEAWKVSQLLDWDVSDMAMLDWDGDGQEELVTIEPFHGDRFVFYRRHSNGGWQKLHEMPCLLGHSLWANEALGRKAVIVGERMGEGRIQLVFPTKAAPAEWEKLVIDRQTGGTNIAVLQATPEILQFVSANNDNNEVVLYTVTP